MTPLDRQFGILLAVVALWFLGALGVFAAVEFLARWRASRRARQQDPRVRIRLEDY